MGEIKCYIAWDTDDVHSKGYNVEKRVGIACQRTIVTFFLNSELNIRHLKQRFANFLNTARDKPMLT